MARAAITGQDKEMESEEINILTEMGRIEEIMMREIKEG